ncbi:ring-finger containing [Fusarium longipes]|uniref:Ring-finger containing n=1 Tax=Fusarium longipes TaxID=694270 RepID=A0A395S023_9HYPO|nr:ring-finger containing [Fusarium longipes]
MDHMDYILSNGHHRSTGHYDPVHSASNQWPPHQQSQNPSLYPWQAQNLNLPHPYSHQVGPSAPGSGPDTYVHHATVLPPLQGLPSPGSFSASMHGPISPRLNSRPQSYRNSMPLPVPSVPVGAVDQSHDVAFANQIPSGTHMGWQSPMPGVEVNSMHRSNHAYPDSGASNFGHNHNNPYFPNFVPGTQPPHPYFPTSARRNHISTTSMTTRGFGGIPSPNRPPPPSASLRRSHPRQRRSTSSRTMATEVGREDEDEGYYGPPDHVRHSPGGSDSSPDADELFIRQLQIARGSVSTKMVASKTTLRSLQSVKLEELSESDRSCVICYNDYGVETPEGINEAPLRLPKCGHIFGDHCIKKWFEDSDSCPYCRDKLHAEPKTQGGNTSRAFMNFIRSGNMNIPLGMAAQQLPDELLTRLRASHAIADRRIDSLPHASAARRSPPREGIEHQHRRTRARHSNSNAHDTLTVPEPRNRAASMETSSQPVVPAVELPSIRPPPEQLPAERQAQEWEQGGTQDASVASMQVQDRGTENQLPPAVLPELSPYASQDAQDQHPRARTLRNPLQVQTGSPFEGLGNNETAPDMPYHSSQRW